MKDPAAGVILASLIFASFAPRLLTVHNMPEAAETSEFVMVNDWYVEFAVVKPVNAATPILTFMTDVADGDACVSVAEFGFNRPDDVRLIPPDPLFMFVALVPVTDPRMVV